jgi:hypothetical protein
MSLLFIEFEWWRDAKGYRLAVPEPPKPRPKEVHPEFGVIHPYELDSNRFGKPQRVVPNGGELIPYQPLSKFDKLSDAFASIRTPETVLYFVQHYGPLTEAGLDPDQGENVEDALKQATFFRDLLNGGRPRRKRTSAFFGGSVTESTHFASLDASLTPDAFGALRLRVLPKNLLDALWLQLAHVLAAGTSIRACLLCGTWFGAGPGTNKRLDAKFCSDEHRVLYNSRRRTKGK